MRHRSHPPALTTVELEEVSPDPGVLGPQSLADALAARGLRQIVACAAEGTLVEALPLNGLVMALHLAYTRHRPLRLSPDDVWLCVAQGVARHIDLHAEALRSRLVSHEGRLRVEVRRDDLALNPSSAEVWGQAIEALVDEVRRHLGGRADWFVADFSTTTPAARVASQITLLGAVQQYFDYRVSSLCGIPRILLAGSPEDWAAIQARSALLRELGLEVWADALEPVLAQLVATAQGRPERAFWRRIYKLEHASGGERVSGWINALFPYLYSSGGTRNPWFEAGEEEASEFDLPKLGDFPSGLAGAPFTWRLLSGDREMTLVAGFVGVTAQEGGIAPVVGWAVTPQTPERRFRIHPGHDGLHRASPRSARIDSLDGLGEQLALDGVAQVTLDLLWCDALLTLDALRGNEAVVGLNVLAGGLAELSAVAELPALQRLRIAQCPGVVDLRPLAACVGLKELAINHCPSVVDWTPIGGLTGLERLDLFGREVPAALHGRHEGPAVAPILAQIRAQQ